jgi:hypothetical protein
MRKKYPVCLGTVLDCLMGDLELEDEVRFDNFVEAKDYVPDAFKEAIDSLTGLCEEIREANHFEDLDQGLVDFGFEYSDRLLGGDFVS